MSKFLFTSRANIFDLLVIMALVELYETTFWFALLIVPLALFSYHMEKRLTRFG
jgi:hypothetical protein